MAVADLRRWISLQWPWVVLVAVGVSSFSIRVFMLGRYPMPSGADPGLYLAQVHLLEGEEVSGFGLVLPPVSMLFLAGLLRVFDPATALRVFSAAPTAFMAFPFYALALRTARRPFALLASVLFVFAEGLAEMTAWGGVPEFYTFSFILGCLVYLLRYLERGQRTDLLLASFLASLVVGTHQLASAVLVLSVALWGVLEVAWARDRRVFMSLVRFGLIAGLLSLPYAPFYADLAEGLAPPVTPLGLDALVGGKEGLAYLVRGTTLVWIGVGVLGVVGSAKAIGRSRESRLYAVVAAVSLVLSITLVRDNPARPLLYLYIPLLLAFGTSVSWFFERGIPTLGATKRRVVLAASLAILVTSSAALVGASVIRMSTAVDFYHAIEAPELDGLNWIRANTPPEAVIATNGPNGQGNWFGWWLEGYSERKAVYSGDLIYASYETERRMVVAANQFFLGQYGIRAGGLSLIDNSPSPANPDILVQTDGETHLAFRLNDSVNVIAYSPASDPATTISWVLPLGAPTETSWAPNATYTLDVIRSSGDGREERSEWIVGDHVFINLDFSVRNGTIRSLEVPVLTGEGFSFGDEQVVGANVTGSLLSSSGVSVPFEFSVSNVSPGAGVTLSTSIMNAPGRSEIKVSLSNTSAMSGLRIRLDFRFPDVTQEAAVRWSAASIAVDYKIGYVFHSRKLAASLPRFAFDPAHYELRYANDAVEIFALR